MAIQSWVFGRYFLENGQTELVTSRKTADSTLIACDTILAFK